MKIGDTVMFLREYSWLCGKVVSLGKVNVKVQWDGKISSIKKEKVAELNESVCIVWELWRGRNGRGGYRVERELYPQFRIPAKDITRRPCTVTSSAGGVFEKDAYGTPFVNQG